MLASDPAALCRNLGYDFRDNSLLDQALTHRSCGQHNYECLEFLGDSVLGFVISAALYQRHPDADEGSLTRMRARLVRRETLARTARRFALGEYLRLGPGELKSGGWNRDSILADAMEAVLGAVYLDSDLETVRALILKLFADEIDKTRPATVEKDAKTRLQEYLQKHFHELPEYITLEVEGEAHQQYFRVECRLPAGRGTVKGEGDSRRKAEQDAAAKALELLMQNRTHG